MSLGIYPVFQPRLRGTKFEAIGEMLALEYQALDRIAVANGLTLFTAFADNRTVPNDFDGSPNDLKELLGPSDQWFDANEGKIAFRALANLIKSDVRAAKEFESPDAVVPELEELVRVLTVANDQAARF